jgi:hypothetical protein
LPKKLKFLQVLSWNPTVLWIYFFQIPRFNDHLILISFQYFELLILLILIFFQIPKSNEYYMNQTPTLTLIKTSFKTYETIALVKRKSLYFVTKFCHILEFLNPTQMIMVAHIHGISKTWRIINRIHTSSQMQLSFHECVLHQVTNNIFWWKEWRFKLW